VAHLSTGSKALDELLEGGLEGGAITLLFGEAGSGKTNICLQVASLVAQIGKKVIYIDTEGVSLERLKQIAGENYEEVMKNILFFEPHTFDEQEKFVEKAVKLAESSLEVGVMILDSATIHYRLTRNDEERGVRKSLSPQLARLLGAASALRDELGTPLPPVERVAYGRLLAATRQALGDERFTRAWATGRAMPFEEFLAEALNAAAIIWSKKAGN